MGEGSGTATAQSPHGNGDGALQHACWHASHVTPVPHWPNPVHVWPPWTGWQKPDEQTAVPQQSLVVLHLPRRVTQHFFTALVVEIDSQFVAPPQQSNALAQPAAESATHVGGIG